VVFLADGRVEMDSNIVKRAIRPHALTRKNALFAGSDGGARHWAVAMALIHTAKLNGVEPMAWLTDVLQRVVSGRTKAHKLHSLLPWNWHANSDADLPTTARPTTASAQHRPAKPGQIKTPLTPPLCPHPVPIAVGDGRQPAALCTPTTMHTSAPPLSTSNSGRRTSSIASDPVLKGWLG